MSKIFFDSSLLDLAQDLIREARLKAVRLVLAESCTGGLISALLTEIPGASDVLAWGVVVYANEAKTGFLGVSQALLQDFGAVSKPVAIAMAQGALQRQEKVAVKEPGFVSDPLIHSRQFSYFSLAVTGIAGPEGGTTAKPVGTVHLAVAGPQGFLRHHSEIFPDTGRSAIRFAAVQAGINILSDSLKQVAGF